MASMDKGQHGLKYSVTSAIGISSVFKADDKGVLDVHRLRIMQKTGEITWIETCCPLSTDATAGSFNISSAFTMQHTTITGSFNTNADISPGKTVMHQIQHKLLKSDWQNKRKQLFIGLFIF